MDIPKLTMDDSLAYLIAVKETFKEEPEKYKEFFKIIQYLCTHWEEGASCYARVMELMKDHPNLLHGFNVFLPDGFKITIPPPKLTMDDSHAYIAAVKEAFKDKPKKILEFLQIMIYIRTRRIDLADGIARVKELMKNHRNLLLGFNVFLSLESKITIPPVANKVTSDDVISYITELKETFHVEPARYTEFFRLLNDYRTHHRVDIVSFMVKVDELLKDHPKLLFDFFVIFLALAETEETTQSVFVKKIKEVLQDGPANYKEFKKLLNDSRARSVQQKNPRAYNLVAKVKERFQADDIHVYKSFLQIVKKLREKNMYTDMVYDEIATLLKDHQDLVVEVSDFFNKPSTSTTSAS